MPVVDLDTSTLGHVVLEYDEKVDPARSALFSLATGSAAWDFTPGTEAPLLYGVVPARRAVLAALRSVVPEHVGSVVPVLHGEHACRSTRRLRCGEQVHVRSRSMGVRQKPSGCMVFLEIELRAAEEVVEVQTMSVFLPGATGAPDLGDAPTPLVDAADLRASVTTPTSRNQSRLYAIASGDDTAFHVDEAEARRYGFTGVIMHGLCTLAVVANEVLDAAGSTASEVRAVSARFSAPALPGADLVTGWVREGRQVGFSASSSGRAVLTRGALELS